MEEKRFTDKFEDNPLAILEEFGLSIRLLSLLEESFDAIYIRNIIYMDKKTFLAGKNIGEKMLEELQASMQKALDEFSHAVEREKIGTS